MIEAVVVLILHMGDPFPPNDTLYSYDSKETERDFDRRRKEIEAIESWIEDSMEYKYSIVRT